MTKRNTIVICRGNRRCVWCMEISDVNRLRVVHIRYRTDSTVIAGRRKHKLYTSCATRSYWLKTVMDVCRVVNRTRCVSYNAQITCLLTWHVRLNELFSKQWLVARGFEQSVRVNVEFFNPIDRGSGEPHPVLKSDILRKRAITLPWEVCVLDD